MFLPWSPVLKSGSLVLPEHKHTAIVTGPQQVSTIPFASPIGFGYLCLKHSPTVPLPTGPVAQVQPCLQLQVHPTHPAHPMNTGIPCTPHPTHPSIPRTPHPTHPTSHAPCISRTLHPTHPASHAPHILVTLCYRKKLGFYQEAGFNPSPSLLLIAGSVDGAEVAHICRGSSSAEVA